MDGSFNLYFLVRTVLFGRSSDSDQCFQKPSLTTTFLPAAWLSFCSASASWLFLAYSNDTRHGEHSASATGGSAGYAGLQSCLPTRGEFPPLHFDCYADKGKYITFSNLSKVLTGFAISHVLCFLSHICHIFGGRHSFIRTTN